MPSLKDIEDRIDSMFGTGDDASEGNGGEEGAVTQGNTATATSGGENSQSEGAEPQPGNVVGQDKSAASTGTQPNAGTQQPGQRQGAQGNTPQQQARTTAARNGDLTDPQGNVVVRAGAERRFYEQAQTATRQMRHFESQVQQLTTQVNAYKEAATVPTQLGLQPVDVVNACQFMAHFRKDPVAAVKNILTEVQAMGYSIEGVTPGTDVGAIKKIVDEAVAPFRQDRTQVQQQTETNARVEAEINSTFEQHPWAQHNATELNSLLQADSTLTLREAVLTLKAFALQHGYDLNQSIGAQHRTAQDGQQQPATTVQQPPPRTNAAMMPAPNSGGSAPTGLMAERKNTSMGGEQSSRAIVREAMREAGFNVDNL